MRRIANQRYLYFFILLIVFFANFDHQAFASSILASKEFMGGDAVKVTCSADAIDLDSSMDNISILELSRMTTGSKNMDTVFKLDNVHATKHNDGYLTQNFPDNLHWELITPTHDELKTQPFKRSMMKAVLMIEDSKCDDAGKYVCKVTYGKDGKYAETEKMEVLNCTGELGIVMSNEFLEGKTVKVTCSADAVNLPAVHSDNIYTVELSRKTDWSNNLETIFKVENAQAAIENEDYMSTNIPYQREWTLELPSLEDLKNQPFQRKLMVGVLTMKDANCQDSGEYICEVSYRNRTQSKTIKYKKMETLNCTDDMLSRINMANQGYIHTLWLMLCAVVVALWTKRILVTLE